MGYKTYEPSPAATLNARSRCVELLLEVVEATERGDDGILERSILERTSGTLALRRRRREVLPEE
jgi:hypothetical protein